MKRESEFKAYLNRNGKHQDYVNYCRAIEKAFGGMDMDVIISSHQNISKVRSKLDLVFSDTKNYMSALNRYLEFVVSTATSSVRSSSTHISSPQYHVSRARGVELNECVEFICEVVDREYASVIQFAKKLQIGNDFRSIPIIISDETPKDEAPDGLANRLGAFFPSSKPYIEIYHRNFESKNAAAVRNCLAHEYFHYLHYSFAGAEYGNASKDLREGLADFFCVLFSIYCNEKDDLRITKNRYNRWKKHFGTFWPYSNALHFYRVHGGEMKYSSNYDEYLSHGSIGKFVQVFGCTEHPRDAYDAMINA